MMMRQVSAQSAGQDLLEELCCLQGLSRVYKRTPGLFKGADKGNPVREPLKESFKGTPFRNPLKGAP